MSRWRKRSAKPYGITCMEDREGSFGVHNTQWTVRLLQTSYTDLSTNYFGDVTKTYQNAFTNAFLR